MRYSVIRRGENCVLGRKKKSCTHRISTQRIVIGGDISLGHRHTSIYDLVHGIDTRDPIWHWFRGIKCVSHPETLQRFRFLLVRIRRPAVGDTMVEGIQRRSWHKIRSFFVKTQHANFGTLPTLLLIISGASVVDIIQPIQHFLILYCGYICVDALP